MEKKTRKIHVKNYDATGATDKENTVLRYFWIRNKVKDVMLLTSNQLDELIDTSLDSMAEARKKKNKFWNWPDVDKSSLHDVRNKKLKFDKGTWNR